MDEIQLRIELRLLDLLEQQKKGFNAEVWEKIVDLSYRLQKEN